MVKISRVAMPVFALVFVWAFFISHEVFAAWDISTATYTGENVSTSPASDPRGFFVSADGTRIFIANFSNQTIYQFSLSTAWDITTLDYDDKSYSVSSQGSPQDVALSADGDKMFVLSFYDRVVYQYTLSTPWDVSTASYDSESVALGSANHYNFHVKRDGTKLFSLNDYLDKVQQYSLTAWDLSTESAGTDYSYSSLLDGQELVFGMGDNGENMYIGTATNERIHWYTLSTPWDTSTATYSGSYKSISAQDSSTRKVVFNPAGTLMIASGSTNDKLYEYVLDGDDPTASTFLPSDGSVGVALDTNLVITFDEAVDVESGNITIYTSSGVVVETIDVTSGKVSGTGTTTITVNPATDLTAGASYYVQIDATAFDDTAGNSFAGIADTTTWNFDVVAAPNIVNAESSQGAGGTFLDTSEFGVMPLRVSVVGEGRNRDTGTKEQVTVSTQSELALNVKIPDTDQVQEVYAMVFGKKVQLSDLDGDFTYSLQAVAPKKAGRYPYTITADYGIFTLSSKGEILITETDDAAPELVNSVDSLLVRLGEGNDSKAYWEKRILTGDKTSLPSLFGAMQWQRAFGSAFSKRLPGSVLGYSSPGL